MEFPYANVCAYCSRSDATSRPVGVADNAQDNQVSATIAVDQSFEVGANDSVWGIASKIAKDEVEVRRIMGLLFEQNTQQFIDGDINRLKKGVF